jgi:hypothetical protein
VDRRYTDKGVVVFRHEQPGTGRDPVHLNGQRYELSRAVVETRLADVAPDTIRKHAVNVNGTLEAPHRPESGFESSVVCFDRVVRVPLNSVQGRGGPERSVVPSPPPSGASWRTFAARLTAFTKAV